MQAGVSFLCLPVNPDGTWAQGLPAWCHTTSYVYLFHTYLSHSMALHPPCGRGCSQRASCRPHRRSKWCAMSVSEHASLPGGKILSSGQKISQGKGARLGFRTRPGCCPSNLGNRAGGLTKQVLRETRKERRESRAQRQMNREGRQWCRASAPFEAGVVCIYHSLPKLISSLAR